MNELLDERLRAQLKGTEEYIRVFIVDELCPKAAGASLPDPPVIVLFAKSMETAKYKQKEVLAHELLHQLNLRHSFHNQSPFTFKYQTTTNTMDYSQHIHSLGVAQWEVMRAKAQSIWTKKK